MRKNDMTQQQLEERETIAKMLSNAGWDGPLEEALFEEGRWCDPEASMMYENENMQIELEYRADEKLIDLTLISNLEEGLAISIYYGNKIKELINTIIGFQSVITESNYKVHLRDIVKICPESYLAVDGEFVQLVDRESSDV
jgi:hypothetical protein